MNDQSDNAIIHAQVHLPARSTAEAKSRLLDWAENRDAAAAANRKRAPKAGTSLLGMALAALGGIALVRTLLPRRRGAAGGTRTARSGAGLVVRLALVVRAAAWLLPIALKTVRSLNRPAVPH